MRPVNKEIKELIAATRKHLSYYDTLGIRALSDLENACWASDNTLDQSKPVKKDKEKSKIKVESHKKEE